MMKYFLFLILFFAIRPFAYSQQSPVYSNYFTNPELINPSYIGASGFTEIGLNYRNQWTGIDGAPSTMNAILQVPVNKKLSFGMNTLSDKRGALATYESSVISSYHLMLTKNAAVDFGLQLGVGRNNIDFNNADLAIDRALENSWYATGAFGINLSLGNLNIAFALPELFNNNLLNESNFEELGLDVTELTLTSLSYEFAISPLWSFEPFALYRTDREGKSQWEGAALATYKGFAWIGVSYRQESGVGGLVGFSVNDWLRFSYAYDAGNQTVAGFGNASHELQLNVRLGKKNKRIDTQNLPLISQNTNAVNAVNSELKQRNQAEYNSVKQQNQNVQTKTKSQKAEAQSVHETIQESVPVVENNINYSSQNELLGPDENQMDPGFYVVVGAFKIKENADRYRKAVEKRGYTSGEGYSPSTGFTYVYIMFTNSEHQARQTTLKIKEINTLYFPEAWVLQIRN
jgi:type IX secretion system PorP/SprF family membrane protein